MPVLDSVLQLNTPDAPGRRPRVAAIAEVFARYGNFTLGGGSATTAVIHRAIVEQRRWIDQATFTLCFGLGRLTPGTNVLAFCAGVGWLLRGWKGALAALLAASIPCAFIVVLISDVFNHLSHHALWQHALRGALAAAVGITVATCWTIAKPHVRRDTYLRVAILAGGAFVAEITFAISPIRVLLAAAAIGALWPQKGKRP